MQAAAKDFKYGDSLPNSLFAKNREKVITLFKSRV
jgi:hypothetical protein